MNMENDNPRGWLGIFGAILTFIGMLIPFMSAYGDGVSFVKTLSESGSAFSAVLGFFILIAELFVFFIKKNGAAKLLATFSLGAFLGFSFGITGIFGEVFDVDFGFGFWLMLIGMIVKFASPYLNTVNSKIGEVVKI